MSFVFVENSFAVCAIENTFLSNTHSELIAHSPDFQANKFGANNKTLNPLYPPSKGAVDDLAPSSIPASSDSGVEISSLLDKQDNTKNAYQLWAEILTKYTTSLDSHQGLVRFNYQELHASVPDKKKLETFITTQSNRTPSQFTCPEALVYWANIYNALTIKVIVDNYPVNSIRQIRSAGRAGPWRQKVITIESENLSLNDIEHGIMRARYKTPMIHYMVNCASVGCPNLRHTPWQAESLHQDTDDAARHYINSPRGVAFHKKKLSLSKIYKWYKQDFGTDNTELLEHITKFAAPKLRQHLKEYQEKNTKINRYHYDWSLNEKAN